MAVTLRWMALAVSVATTLIAAWLFDILAVADGWTPLDTLRLLLSSGCVFWLTWGAMSGLIGLFAPARRSAPMGPLPRPKGRTAILMPIYHEDPPSTFARVAAMSVRLTALNAHDAFDIFILSDSQSLEAAARETLWFETLLTDCAAREQLFYRRRPKNIGRKAGNLQDFITRSGGAYDYAIVLDADSLMEGDAILQMVARMEATSDLGLLQTLPTIVHARSIFGRALQFAADLYTPVYARGTALMQGREGPYWGHNAIFRVTAFAASCGLPELSGRPPFGGHVLSHDYVEAALLSRAGYEVRLDATIEGSYEEGPDNILDFAKRDQRWCQGNLQHSKVLLAPELRTWNRITLLQGIFNYLMPPIWLVLLIISIAAADMSRITIIVGPGVYWPEIPFDTYRPDTPDWAGWALIGFVAGILILPKLLIAFGAIARGRTDGPGRAVLLVVSVLAEVLLSTFTAPIVLMFQVRAVLRVLLGTDGGWPASNRSDATLTVTQATASSWWISCCGGAGLAVVIMLAPALAVWSLPVSLPMIVAPLIVAATSHGWPPLSRLWRVPTEDTPSPALREWQQIHDRWTAPDRPSIEQGFTGGAANVLG